MINFRLSDRNQNFGKLCVYVHEHDRLLLFKNFSGEIGGDTESVIFSGYYMMNGVKFGRCAFI